MDPYSTTIPINIIKADRAKPSLRKDKAKRKQLTRKKNFYRIGNGGKPLLDPAKQAQVRYFIEN